MSRLTSTVAVGSGLVGIVLMTVSIFGGGWLRCRERSLAPKAPLVGFRIGLWRVCPAPPHNFTEDDYLFKNDPNCINIGYHYWTLDNFNHLDVWSNLQFTPQFVSRMRVCTPFACIGLVLMSVATLCSLFGKHDNAMLMACGLFILAGILIGSGLLMFASILSDSYYEGLNGDSGPDVGYAYDWGFVYAAVALVMAMQAVVFSVTSHVYNFDSLDDMVLVMVPGADRRLLQRVSRAPELVPPLASFKDVDSKRPDLMPQDGQPDDAQPMPARYKTLRYAAPPRPPARFHSLPRRPQDPPPDDHFCTKSAV